MNGWVIFATLACMTTVANLFSADDSPGINQKPTKVISKAPAFQDGKKFRQVLHIQGMKRVLVCEVVNETHHHYTTLLPAAVTNGPRPTAGAIGTSSKKECEECPLTQRVNFVCGSDGNMYASMCHVRDQVCLGRDLTLAHQAGRCGYPSGASINPCNFECLLTDAPVCGSNGITYPSLCHLEKECECGGKQVKLARDGLCEERSKAQCPMSCRVVESPVPVCGSDGVTYPSECLLTTARVCHGRHVHLAHQGNCKREGGCPKTCPGVRAPVCGSDNITYLNPCLLRASACKGSGARFVHSGFCDPEEDCGRRECEGVSEAVCGTDGHTYASECHLKMSAQCEFIIVSLLHLGPCASAPRALPLHPSCCPDEVQPVCGSDGQTYANLCFLRETMECEKRFIVVLHPGPCGETREQSQCPPPLSPTQPNCTYRQDTCFSCRDCTGIGELCCSDGCSFHCMDSVGY